MNDKGQVTMAVILALIVGLVMWTVGVTIVNDVAFPACHGVGQACYADHNFSNVSYFNLPNTNIEPNTEKVYNASTCTGTPLTATVDYTMNTTAGGIIMGAGDWNISNQSTRYATFTSGSYLGGGIKCTILDNFAVMFALAGLILAIGWVYFKD